MKNSNVQSKPASPISLAAIAWIATILVSSLLDIIWFELTGSQPFWIFWVKAFLLGAFILSSWLWRQIQLLRSYLIMLLVLALLSKIHSWILGLPFWSTWQETQSFVTTFVLAQLIEMGMALLLVAVLFLMGKRRQDSFLVRGDINAQAEPICWFGQKSLGPLWRFGLVFTLFVIVSQVFMFILPLAPSASTLGKLAPFIPLILLLAASNGLNEELIYRTAPIALVYEAVGKSNAVGMAAFLFGMAHYIGGIPSGIFGVLITALLGWFFGKCMMDSKGFFWAWLFHAIQDILPFTLMVLSALS